MREWPRLSWPHRIALGLVLLLIGLFALRQVASPDIGFHLRAGSYILSGNGWPQTDPFTYTVNDHAYIDTSWGYQVCLALVERISGAPGMILLHAALVLAVFSLVALASGENPWAANEGLPGGDHGGGHGIRRPPRGRRIAPCR